MGIKFSIGIPVYKARFLKECIDSILAQTILDYELIIVNDASPDDIDSIVSQYDDSRISYYINETNFGAAEVVDNWNKCLSYAQGDYFVLMGDDDRMMPEYLAEFLVLIQRFPEHNVYHCRSYIINELSEKITLTPSWPETENVYDNIWHRMKGLRRQYISDFVYKTEWLKESGGFYKLPLAWGSDEVTSYLAMSEAGIAHINIPVFSYRSNQFSITSSTNYNLKLKAIEDLDKWLSNFLAKPPVGILSTIAYKNVIYERTKYIRKCRIGVVVDSLIQSFGKNFLYWIWNRKKYGLKYVDILYACMESIKIRYARHLFTSI